LLACQKGAFLSMPAATVQGAERFAIVPHGLFWLPAAVRVGFGPGTGKPPSTEVACGGPATQTAPVTS
jgi:hypothetical protein